MKILDVLLASTPLQLARKVSIFGDRWFAGQKEHKRITPPRFFEKYHWWHWRQLRKFRAPVVPYTWVQEKVRRTRRPVMWDNDQGSGWVAKYVSEWRDGEIITRVRAGSYKVSDDWLRPI